MTNKVTQIMELADLYEAAPRYTTTKAIARQDLEDELNRLFKVQNPSVDDLAIDPERTWY